MSERPREWTEWDVARRLKAVAQRRPSAEASERAVRSAIGAVERVASVERRGRWHITRRLLMRTGVAAALAGVVAVSLSVLTVLGPSQTVSAAEVLRRAEAARESFDGWYTLEVLHAETGEWLVDRRINSKEGKRFVRLADNAEQLAKGMDASGWVYIDPQTPLSVRYDPSRRTATVAGSTNVGIVFEEMPLSESKIAQWVETERRYSAATRNVGDDIEVELRRLPAVLDAEGKADPSYEYWPARVVATFDRDEGLLRAIAVQQKEEEALMPWARLRYDTEPITDWRALIGEGITIEDRRPDAATTEVLDKLDAILRGGPGFVTALLVQRNGDRITGTLHDNGRLTLFAEREHRWLEFEWTKGEEIAGWPEPTLDAVLAYLQEHPPERVAVFDGSTCWWRWEADGAWTRKTGDEAVDRGQNHRLSHLIWWGRPQLNYSYGSEPPTITSRRDARRSNGVILQADVITHWAGTPEGEMRLGHRQTMLVQEDRGPFPLLKTIERFKEDGSLWNKEEWEYSETDVKMYRRPVRVPLRWTKRYESDNSGGTLPQFYHLLPQPGRTLDAEWFGDPSKRWPATKSAE